MTFTRMCGELGNQLRAFDWRTQGAHKSGAQASRLYHSRAVCPMAVSVVESACGEYEVLTERSNTTIHPSG